MAVSIDWGIYHGYISARWYFWLKWSKRFADGFVVEQWRFCCAFWVPTLKSQRFPHVLAQIDDFPLFQLPPPYGFYSQCHPSKKHFPVKIIALSQSAQKLWNFQVWCHVTQLIMWSVPKNTHECVFTLKFGFCPKKNLCRMKWKRIQHWVFPSGHPSKY